MEDKYKFVMWDGYTRHVAFTVVTHLNQLTHFVVKLNQLL
jgi:hypothetical protein